LPATNACRSATDGPTADPGGLDAELKGASRKTGTRPAPTATTKDEQ